MMKSEFENLAGRAVTDEQYRANLTRKSNLKTTGKVGKTKGFRRFCRPCNRY